MINVLNLCQSVSGLGQQSPHVRLSPLEDLAHVVHLNVKNANVDLIEGDGLQVKNDQLAFLEGAQQNKIHSDHVTE